MLALIFAAPAQGLQNGVFDRYGGQWVAGAMEEELRKEMFTVCSKPSVDVRL
jgi:hypothetical protein